MKAFHNDERVKSKYLSRVNAHALAAEIVKGRYWEGGKGCAVGCTIHSDDHKAYERELGIPEWLARLEDTIFEGLPDERAKLWPEQFLSAIPIGADLDKIKTPFIIFVLESALASMLSAKYDEKKNPEIKAAITVIKEVIRCHKTGEDLESAESAAWSAVKIATPKAVMRPAEWVKRSVWVAMWLSRRSEVWPAVWSAERSARLAEYEKFADKLLELIGGVEK